MAEPHSSRARKRALAPKKAVPAIVDLKDRIDHICDVVQTVCDALNDHNSLPAAMTLSLYALEPLYAIKEELQGDDELDDDEDESP